MMKTLIYLDNAATTRPDPLVVEAMQEMLDDRWGNPSSAHEAGSRAKIRIEEARVAIAALAGCQTDEVSFTSGGTEADNWALLGVLDYWRGKRDHLITVVTEHHAVYDTALWWRERGGAVTLLPVDADGRLDPQVVAAAITDRTALVSVMHINNELGTLQDVAAIGAICRERGVTFHIDCVQSFGKIPLDAAGIHADLLSISAHKIYGPKGVGALIVRRGVRISPRALGGSQERKLRTGTENVPGIVGFGMAAELCRARLQQEIIAAQTMRDRLETLLLEQIPAVRVNGSREYRAPGILNAAFTGCDGEALLIALDRKGFCVSTGSACSAGALGASHVLTGIGLEIPVAASSLRFSFGRFNTTADVDALIDVLPALVERQRQSAPAAVS